jgi:hypothetical protein
MAVMEETIEHGEAASFGDGLLFLFDTSRVSGARALAVVIRFCDGEVFANQENIPTSSVAFNHYSVTPRVRTLA